MTTTVGELLSKLFPKIITDSPDESAFIVNSQEMMNVYCNGISCDLNMPIAFLERYFSHYDGFVYIAVVFARSKATIETQA